MRKGLTVAFTVGATLAAEATIGGQRPVYRTGTQAVSVDVSVRNGNVTVAGLTSADFRLRDNNVPQTITAVALRAVPIDVTLFLDTSPSTAGSHESLKADVRNIAGMLRPDDRLRLLTLDSKVRDVFGWQPPTGELPMERVSAASTSNVCDALVAALLRRPEPERRHVVIALTDGIDVGSVIGCRILKQLAPRSEAVLHVVRVGSSPVPGSRGPRQPVMTYPDLDGVESIEDAADSTGGRMHDSANLFSRGGVAGAFQRTFDLFRESYVLRFTTEGVETRGWHELKVEVVGKGRVTVRARRGTTECAEGALRPWCPHHECTFCVR